MIHFMPQIQSPKRRAECADKLNGTARTSGRAARRRDFTTAGVVPRAMDLLAVALPFTQGHTGPRGTESATEFVSLAIADRVARLKAIHGFVLPPGLSLEISFTKPN